jgi:hypothetical protein
MNCDGKKNGLVSGTKAIARPEWQPEDRETRLGADDLANPEVPEATRCGVHDVGPNKEWMSAGDDHDTGAFAVNAIHLWWRTMDRDRYREATELLIMADVCATNCYRNRLC